MMVPSSAWTIPTTLTAGSDYRIRITSTTNSAISDMSNGYFTVTSTLAPKPTVAPVIQGNGNFGSAANPTGNPIGGGAGYTRILSETGTGVKYVVSTKAELLTALRSAKAGEIVFVKGTAVIDMTGNAECHDPCPASRWRAAGDFPVLQEDSSNAPGT